MSPCRSLSLAFLLLFPALWCGIKAQGLVLRGNRVLLAFPGDKPQVICGLTKPANRSETTFNCFDPCGEVFHSVQVDATVGMPLELSQIVRVTPSSSGEYYCEHQADRVHWYLRLADGYMDVAWNDYSECISVGVVVAVLSVFNVAGSWYVFRCGWCRAGGSRPDWVNRRRVVEENADQAAASSVYASLDPHTQSVYAVLERTSVGSDPGQKQGPSRSKKSPKTVSPAVQGDGVFESVYENF